MTGLPRLRLVPRYHIKECLKLSSGPCTIRRCRFNIDHDDSKHTRDNSGRQLANRIATREELGTDKITCAIDVANMGGLTLETVGAIIGTSRQRVKQIEESALRKLEQIANGFGEIHIVKLLRGLRGE